MLYSVCRNKRFIYVSVDGVDNKNKIIHTHIYCCVYNINSLTESNALAGQRVCRVKQHRQMDACINWRGGHQPVICHS